MFSFIKQDFLSLLVDVWYAITLILTPLDSIQKATEIKPDPIQQACLL